MNHEFVIAYTFTSQDLKNELDKERREPYVSSGLINVCMVFNIVFVHWWMSATRLSQVRFGTLDITANAHSSYPIYEVQLAIWAAINGRTEVMLQWLVTVGVTHTCHFSVVSCLLTTGAGFSCFTKDVRGQSIEVLKRFQTRYINPLHAEL
jgi:hypothetical protein